LVDRDGLWFKVLAARYGVTEGRLNQGVVYARLGGGRWGAIVMDGE